MTRSQGTPTSGLNQVLTSEILGGGAEHPLDDSVKTLSLRQASGTGVQGCAERVELCALTISGTGAVLTPPMKGQVSKPQVSTRGPRPHGAHTARLTVG